MPLLRFPDDPSTALGSPETCFSPARLRASTSGLRLIVDPAEFSGLADAWNVLVARRPRARVFLCHEWFDAAWRWRQSTARLWLLCRFRDGRLSAVLPLISSSATRCHVRVRELSFLAVPDTQACDVIASEDDETGACEAFAAALAERQREWDVLRLAYLVPDSVAATSFPAALMRAGFAVRLDPVDTCPYIPLTTTWSAYAAKRSPGLRKAELEDSRRLQRAGQVRLEWLAPGTGHAADRDDFVNRAIEISARSWKARSGSALDSAAPRAFIRRLSESAHERGWLSIWLLSLGQRPVAMEYHLVADGRVYALRSDFDEAFRKLSPGSHLRRRLVEEMFGLGLERYCMGPGFNAHKRRWTDEAEAIHHLTVYGRSPVGRGLGAWEQAVKPLARRLAHGTRPAGT